MRHSSTGRRSDHVPPACALRPLFRNEPNSGKRQPGKRQPGKRSLEMTRGGGNAPSCMILDVARGRAAARRVDGRRAYTGAAVPGWDAPSERGRTAPDGTYLPVLRAGLVVVRPAAFFVERAAVFAAGFFAAAMFMLLMTSAPLRRKNQTPPGAGGGDCSSANHNSHEIRQLPFVHPCAAWRSASKVQTRTSFTRGRLEQLCPGFVKANFCGACAPCRIARELYKLTDDDRARAEHAAQRPIRGRARLGAPASRRSAREG